MIATLLSLLIGKVHAREKIHGRKREGESRMERGLRQSRGGKWRVEKRGKERNSRRDSKAMRERMEERKKDGKRFAERIAKG